MKGHKLRRVNTKSKKVRTGVTLENGKEEGTVDDG